MKAKRIHELPEINNYDFEHSIIVDKPNEETSNMIKLGNLIDLVLSYQTIGTPIIIDSDINNTISLNDSQIFEPEVSGSNLKFELENAPDFMTINEQTGIMTINPNEVGTFNNILLKISNLYGEATELFNIRVINRLPKSTKRIDYLSSNKTKRTRINNELFVNELKNITNNVTYNTTFSKPRVVLNTNKYKSMYFDGNDDSLICNNYMKDRLVKSFFIAFKPELTNKNYFPIIGDYSNGHQIALDNRSGKNGFSFDGNSSNSARFSINGSELSEYHRNIYDKDYFINNEWNYMYVDYENSYTTNNINIATSFPHFSHGTHMYKGFIGGIILFNNSLDNEEITNYYNYLTSIYNHD